MARIPLTGGFTIIPEGEYVFRIYDVSYDEMWGKLDIHLITAQGMTTTERFTLKDAATDEPNEKAMNAFSFFAKTAMNNFNLTDVDPMDLVNHYIRATVTHFQSPSRKDPNKMFTYVNLGDKQPADGFEGTPVPEALTKGKTVPKEAAPTPAPAAEASPAFDLDSLLG